MSQSALGWALVIAGVLSIVAQVAWGVPWDDRALGVSLSGSGIDRRLETRPFSMLNGSRQACFAGLTLGRKRGKRTLRCTTDEVAFLQVARVLLRERQTAGLRVYPWRERLVDNPRQLPGSVSRGGWPSFVW